MHHLRMWAASDHVRRGQSVKRQLHHGIIFAHMVLYGVTIAPCRGAWCGDARFVGAFVETSKEFPPYVVHP
jgi:hypothetical protein